MKNILQLLIGLLISILAVGCGESADPTKTFDGGYPINVVCTTGMVADLVKNVGGNRVKVTTLLGPGVDPHLYQPSSGDTVTLQDADIIFYSGLHLEGKMTQILERIGEEKPVYAVTENLQAQDLMLDEGKTKDPHVWFDVSLWKKACVGVQEELARFDPKHAEEYRSRGADYQKVLAKLHKEVKKKIGEIPPKQRVLITAHDAFRYFGKAYNISVKGIQGISTADEANLQHINRLREYIKENRIKAIFVETSVNEKNVQALLAGFGEKDHQVELGGTLYSDAMGAPGSGADTYAGMVRHNVNTIVEALK